MRRRRMRRRSEREINVLCEEWFLVFQGPLTEDLQS